MSATNAAKAAPFDSEISMENRAPSEPFGTSGSSVSFLAHQHFSDDNLNAIAARQAGRINAANIKDAEVERLFEERKSLISKRYSSGLSKAEDRRLALVRWNLDRIQDAKHGQTLDALEAAVTLYERIGEDISRLMVDLQTHAPRGRR